MKRYLRPLVDIVAAIVAIGACVALYRLGIMGLLGAGSAAGSLALARRADDQELLESGEDVADAGLTEREKRELLGR